jgi:CRP-like cAMP-binding protein
MDLTVFAPASMSGNGLIDSAGPDEHQRLRYQFKVVSLQPRQTLYAPGDTINYAYFPVSAVVTATATTGDGATAETAMIGRDGVVGLGAATRQDIARNWTRVLLPGAALRLDAYALREIFDESHAWQSLLLRYYAVLIGQVSRRAICNARHRLSERFATWLLMVRDRASDDEFPLTQETIARQLGVRRAGVNECVVALQRGGVLDHRRAYISVLRREALEAAACSCYPACREEMRWTERRAQAPHVAHTLNASLPLTH